MKIILGKIVIAFLGYYFTFYLSAHGQKLKTFTSVPGISDLGAGLFKGIYNKLIFYPEASGLNEKKMVIIRNDSIITYTDIEIGIFAESFLSMALDSTSGNILFNTERISNGSGLAKGGLVYFNGTIFSRYDRANLTGFTTTNNGFCSNPVYITSKRSFYFSEGQKGIYRKPASIDSNYLERITDTSIITSISSGQFLSGYSNNIIQAETNTIFNTNLYTNITNYTTGAVELLGQNNLTAPIYKTRDSTFLLIGLPNSFFSRNKVNNNLSEIGLDSFSAYPAIDKRGNIWSFAKNYKYLYFIRSLSKFRKIKLSSLGLPENSGNLRIAVDTLNNKWLAFNQILYKLTDINPKLRVKEIYQGCNADSLVFIDSSTTIGEGIAKRIWKFSDGFSVITGPDQNVVKHRFTSLGNQWATITVVDTNGSKDKDSINVSVLNLSTVLINPRPIIETCKTIVTLTSQGTSNPKWYAAPFTFLSSNSTLTVTQPGKYILRDSIKIGNQTCIRQDTVRIIKRPPSLGSLELSNSTNGNTITTDTIFSSDIKSILISGTPQGSTFSLVVNGDNLKKNPAIVSTDSLDKLDIFYTSKDQDSCQFFVSKTVYIKTKIVVPEPPKPEFVPNLPNLITANNDAFNQSFTDKTGSFPAGYTLEVFNRWGQSIFKRANYQNEWPETATKEGLYFYMLTSPTGTKYTGWVDMMR